MMDGVVRAPSEFSITLGLPLSMMATQELVVPRSIPIIVLGFRLGAQPRVVMLGCLQFGRFQQRFQARHGFLLGVGFGRIRFGFEFVLHISSQLVLAKIWGRVAGFQEVELNFPSTGREWRPGDRLQFAARRCFRYDAPLPERWMSGLSRTPGKRV
jgi:hypothetical protein